jgi:hypothetical protein
MLWKFNFIVNWVSNSITEFERKIKNKNNLRKRTLVDQATPCPRDVDLKNSSCWEGERERETRLQNNIKAKPEQLKLSKTYPST